MTAARARTWIVYFALVMLFALIIFSVVASRAGYPLHEDETDMIAALVFPVFAGYFAAAVTYVASPRPTRAKKQKQGDAHADGTAERGKLLGVVLGGAVVLPSAWILFILVNFWSSHQTDTVYTGGGMSVSRLMLSIIGAVAFMNATLGVLVAHVFNPPQDS